jgi:tRNA-specific 2-thiouridylase
MKMINKIDNKKSVMIGMSGGVDSSVAAALLLEQGYDVIGVTLKLLDYATDEEKSCCSLSAVEDARRVANSLGISYYVLNFKELFNVHVINNFISEYKNGRTPNPCIACNRYIKFGTLLKKAQAMGIDYVATGHYAKVQYDNNSGRYQLRKSVTASKDQTYALYNLTQEQLSHILMPIGNYEKDAVRQKAKDLGLNVATKPDSQEICFIEDDDYGRFLNENMNLDEIIPGNFIDTNGKVLGSHRGIIYYTIGQRKGLGIAFGHPMFVVDIISESNVIVLGENNDTYSDALIAEDLNFISVDGIPNGMRIKAKIRYSAKEAPAVILKSETDGEIQVKFDEPQRAITPGQAVVFYDGEIVVGGGVIKEKL